MVLNVFSVFFPHEHQIQSFPANQKILGGDLLFKINILDIPRKEIPLQNSGDDLFLFGD